MPGAGDDGAGMCLQGGGGGVLEKAFIITALYGASVS